MYYVLLVLACLIGVLFLTEEPAPKRPPGFIVHGEIKYKELDGRLQKCECIKMDQVEICQFLLDTGTEL